MDAIRRQFRVVSDVGRVAVGQCAVCARRLPASGGVGRPRAYCSSACRQKAYRRRREAYVRYLAERLEDAGGVVEVGGDLAQE